MLAGYRSCPREMKAYEFTVKVSPSGTVELPEGLLAKIPRSHPLRLILLVPEQADLEEDTLWSRSVAEQFVTGYAEADSIYDNA